MQRKTKRKGKKRSGKSKEKVKRIKQNEGAPLTKPRAFLLWFFFHSSSKAPRDLRFNSQTRFKQKQKKRPKNIKLCQASFIEQSKLRTPSVVTKILCKNTKNQNLVLEQKLNLIVTLTHTRPNFR
jgi:hypothetical protein